MEQQQNGGTQIPDDSWGSGFVSGLICGEGNFLVTVAANANARLKYSVRVVFQMEMHEREKPLLEAIQRFFGFGLILAASRRKRSPNEGNTYRYSVIKIADCLKLADFFEENPLVGSKYQSFMVWKECLQIVRTKEHTSTEGFLRIISLRDTINSSCRPSTYVCENNLIKRVAAGIEGRRLDPWSSEDEATVLRYVKGEIDRRTLENTVKRIGPSLDNKISRVRKQAGNVSAQTIQRYIDEQKGG